MFFRYFLLLTALCEASQRTIPGSLKFPTVLTQSPERIDDPLEYSNLLPLDPLDRIELVKKSVALGLLREAYRPPLSLSSDAATYYYETSNSYISLSGDNCDANQYQVQLASSGAPMNSCNYGYTCTCNPTGTGKDYVLNCDYYDAKDCSGTPAFSTEYDISPKCSKPANWYATYGVECLVTSTQQVWNLNPSTAFLYRTDPSKATCSSPVGNFGSTFDKVCLTQIFCFSGAPSCIQSCSGSSLKVTNFNTKDCSGSSTTQDLSSLLGCNCVSNLECQSTVCSSATTAINNVNNVLDANTTLL